MNASPGNIRNTIRSLSASSLLALGLVALPLSAAADYRVSAYKATPGFTQIMNEQYEDALEIASSRAPVAPKYAMASNRCVSALMTAALDTALASCNDAIGYLSAYSSPVFNSKDRDESASELLSNRGVVLALKGDVAAAESDFLEAVALDAENKNAAQNLKYLRSTQLAANSADD